MQVDHIIPDGGDHDDNLCLACWSCNNYKRKATHSRDSLTDSIVPLFNPRTQSWNEHFEWTTKGTVVEGKTAIGRATIQRLKMNRPTLVVARQRWVDGGYHPPK